MHWISGTVPNLSQKYDIRFRYRQSKQKCKIISVGDGYKINSDNKQFGIAPGQSAVIYSGEVCLGGGVIE